jgi:hypothetical protein
MQIERQDRYSVTDYILIRPQLQYKVTFAAAHQNIVRWVDQELHEYFPTLQNNTIANNSNQKWAKVRSLLFSKSDSLNIFTDTQRLLKDG